MPEWQDSQTDPEKLNSLRRREVISLAKEACEAEGNLRGILVKRDITSVDLVNPLRLVAGPHDSAAPYTIVENE